MSDIEQCSLGATPHPSHLGQPARVSLGHGEWHRPVAATRLSPQTPDLLYMSPRGCLVLLG